MATPKLTAREKALRKADRAYWRFLEEGVDDGRFAEAILELEEAEMMTDECPPDCPYCSQYPWWRGPAGGASQRRRNARD